MLLQLLRVPPKEEALHAQLHGAGDVQGDVVNEQAFLRLQLVAVQQVAEDARQGLYLVQVGGNHHAVKMLMAGDVCPILVQASGDIGQ